LQSLQTKEGSGKTAITANLAHALANKGKRVLVVDYDSQSNSTNILLGESMPSHTLNDVLLGKAPINRAISATPYDNLDVLANESITAALEVMFYKDLPNSYYLLRSMLNPIRDKYDLLLLDTPPSLGHWTIQALTAADAVIVPIDASSKHSLQGLNAAIRAIKDISDSFNPGVCFLRAILNKVDRRTAISKAMVEQISRVWSEQLFDTSIPTCTAVQKAETASETVIRYDPHCSASKRFRSIAEELLSIVATTSEHPEPFFVHRDKE